MPLPSPSSLAAYGGALTNYLGQGVIDPTTDLDAAAHNQSMSDLAGISATAPRAWAVFNAAVGPTISTSAAVWTNTGGAAPTVARTGVGVYTVTWPSSVVDLLGVSQSLVIRVATAVPTSGGSISVAYATISGTAVNVTVFNPSTLGAADSGASIMVSIY